MEIKAIGNSEGREDRDKQLTFDVGLSRKGSVCFALLPGLLPADSHRPRWTGGLGFGIK